MKMGHSRSCVPSTETNTMHEVFFGLARRPFASVPYATEYFPAATVETARQTLARCIERAEGAAMVVGPSGTGKTLLCQLLCEQFRGHHEVVQLASGRLSTRRALFQAILYWLGQAYRGMDEGELRLALVDYLGCEKRCPTGILLVIDEAHTLSLRLLDEVRMLTNMVSNGRPRTRLVLAGNPLLEERLASPRLESFSQRLVARCYLEAFNRTETEQYISACLAKAGGQGRTLFTPEACQAVFQATDGVPRLINQVCDHALLQAHTTGRQQVERATVEEAWADLQQLPMPWNGKTEGKSEEAAIEFGTLEDEPVQQTPAPSVAAVSTPVSLRQTPDPDSLEVEPTGDLPDEVEEIQGMLPELDDSSTSAASSSPCQPNMTNPLCAGQETTPRTCGADVPAAPAGETPAPQVVSGQARITPARKNVLISLREMGGISRSEMSTCEELPCRGNNPFDEPFAEEEVVADRFVPVPDRTACPASHSIQAPVVEADPAEQASMATVEAVIPVAKEGGEETLPEEHGIGHDEATSDEEMASEGAEPDGTLSLRFEENQDAWDGGLAIVVEDEYDDAGPLVCPLPTVRRQEYRQLFTNLRHG
jgi:type II secretory pathway predicted ATPase ExeA